MFDGTIFVPKRFHSSTYVTDRYDKLFEAILEKLNWKLLYKNTITEEDVEGNYLLIFKTPQDDEPNRGEKLHNLSKDIKLICYYTDIVANNRINIYKQNIEKLLARADLILCAYDEMFRNLWNKYEYKYVWFPQFFAPTERYTNLKIESNKIFNKCLIPGMIDNRFYPLRGIAANNTNLFSILNHPGYRLERIGSPSIKLKDEYAKELNKYLCCFTCCSKFKYVLAKHMEIPASGSLLISDRCNDLDKLGFVSGKHYIEVNRNNIHDTVKEVLNNVNKYFSVAETGRNFVVENFNLEKRVEQFINLVENV